MSFFEWLAQTPYVQWVQESWGWPVALTLHAFGTATIVGLMAIITLRMLGLFRTIPYSAVQGPGRERRDALDDEASAVSGRWHVRSKDDVSSRQHHRDRDVPAHRQD